MLRKYDRPRDESLESKVFHVVYTVCAALEKITTIIVCVKKNIDANSLLRIPGVGKSIVGDLNAIGIFSVSDLKNKNPEKLFDRSNAFAGMVQDRCLLYVFRCAVYYANGGREPEKLQWWFWKDLR